MRTPKTTYKQCDSTRQEHLNYKLKHTKPNLNITNTPNDIYIATKNWLSQGLVSLPKAHPKDNHQRFELSENARDILEKRHTTANKQQQHSRLPTAHEQLYSKHDIRCTEKNNRISLKKSRLKGQMARY